MAFLRAALRPNDFFTPPTCPVAAGGCGGGGGCAGGADDVLAGALFSGCPDGRGGGVGTSPGSRTPRVGDDTRAGVSAAGWTGGGGPPAFSLNSAEESSMAPEESPNAPRSAAGDRTGPLGPLR